MERQIYLEDIPLDDAWAAFRAALDAAGLWQPLAAETVPLSEANGRVTAAAVWARLSSPHYHAAAMDGYAVRAGETVGATDGVPLEFALIEEQGSGGAGEQGSTLSPLLPRSPAPLLSATPVNTGHPLPPWANAVIMIEHVQPVTLPDGRAGIAIRAAVPPWQHVRAMGEDMVATELVLPANHRLRPVDLGALAGSGHATVSAYRRPRVAIIPTGSELVAVEAGAPEPGHIIEYNSLVLAAQVENWGGLPTRWPIVPDDLAAIRAAVLAAAADHDLILLNAGSSAGSEDYTAPVVQSLGRLLVHGVAVRPGHPVVLGMVEEMTNDELRMTNEEKKQGDEPSSFVIRHSSFVIPLIGVPGYPVSAALTGEIFVEPLLARWQGQPPHRPATLEGALTRKIVSHTGDDDYVRVVVGRVGDHVTVTPISRGAGIITSLVRADGIVRVPRFSEGHDAGASVTVHLYRDPRAIEQAIVAIGSHDLTLDLLAQFLAERHNGLRLISANVGSLGGLIALRRGEAHLGGAHLLDPATGEYNLSYIRRYLPGEEVAVVSLVGREQGWIVAPGNPLGLRDWADAARPDIRLVNRQRGAGTRVLLDYELGKLGIDPAAVRGYEREEYTHLAVAAAVASGAADAGLGIRAAARALNLDFAPLAHETYELVIPRAHYESERLQPLLALLHDSAFRAAVAAMPGYDVGGMGDVRLLTNH
ncbi:Molybdopterin biosynthesis protein [Candidatus Promineifilum breve]|uniref:Molybdopterin molybdenumtransferase n=1 Tax=Candidatus Promineifilum breve TaxID=1806508 RepID=A0A170PG91_9CHLR|nr:molybdopterin biosynthesis protein [Candidatus Promineifilum breve]CUS03623.2 Molybdopterin biosynthesis protein [Candidatus Promineifilum breve]